jgi:hypothetical protein
MAKGKKPWSGAGKTGGGKGKGGNRIGNVVAGDMVVNGTRVSGPVVDGKRLPQGDVLEIKNGKIYVDGKEIEQ